MQTTTIPSTAPVFRFNRIFLAGMIAVIILLGAFFAFRNFSTRTAFTIISQSTLETQYGLRVNLIAVTAAGGKVDLRLKVVDAAKAQAFLQDKNNYPSLVTEKGEILSIPQDERGNFQVKEAFPLLLLFANTGGAVQPGTTVSLQFGGTRLEPLIVK